LFSEYNTRLSYQRYKASETLFYVRRSHWSKLQTIPESEDYWKSVIPRFDRTRMVSLNRVGGMTYLKCSCMKFETCGRACRHMYCVLGRQPCKNDCSIKYFKLFEAHYGATDNDKFTKLCDAIIENPPAGPPVDWENDFRHLDEEDACFNDLTWFQQAIGKIIMRPGIISHGRGQTLETIGNFGDFGTSQELEYDGGLFDDNDNDDDNDPDMVRAYEGFNILILLRVRALELWNVGTFELWIFRTLDLSIFGYCLTRMLFYVQPPIVLCR
jgi:hypothetical protein